MGGADDREPFTPAFVAAWEGRWGGNHLAAFVEDRTTGATFSYGDADAAFPLASVAKLAILAGTLEAVDQGRWDLDAVAGLADRMIRVSDNAAAAELWSRLGGAAAVNDLAERWGLGATAASAARGFGGTLSTAADQVRLVTLLVGDDAAVLSDAARDHARGLLTSVDPGQAWGVSAGVRPGWSVALKNGWYPTGPADLGPAGRWRVNSAGFVRDDAGHERWAMAVLGNTWGTMGEGIDAIEALAARVAEAFSSVTASVVVPWTPSPPATGGDLLGFVPVAPVRVLDTRAGGGAVPAGATRTVDVTGATGPAVSAAVVHLTAVGAAAAGYLAAFAADTARPLASNVNYAASRPSSNDALVTLTDGRLEVFTSAATDLIVDVAGAYVAGGGLLYAEAAAPLRLLDTRATGPTEPAGSVTIVTVPSLDGWPVRAAVVNVTAVDGAVDGFVTAFPADRPRPATSTLNHPPGRAVAAGATVATSADGSLALANSAAVAIVVDLIGVFTGNPAGRWFRPAAPQRMLDTRAGLGGWQGALGADQTITVPLGLPPGASAVGTLTAVGAGAAGFVTLWAGDGARPVASTLNVAPGDTIANLTTSRVAADGSIALYAQSGRVDLVYDLVGWFA